MTFHEILTYLILIAALGFVIFAGIMMFSECIGSPFTNPLISWRLRRAWTRATPLEEVIKINSTDVLKGAVIESTISDRLGYFGGVIALANGVRLIAVESSNIVYAIHHQKLEKVSPKSSIAAALKHDLCWNAVRKQFQSKVQAEIDAEVEAVIGGVSPSSLSQTMSFDGERMLSLCEESEKADCCG